MKRYLIGAFAAMGLAVLPMAANATVWISQLEYKNSAPTVKVSSPFGYVRVEDGLSNGTEVDIAVFLNAGYSLFLDTGNSTTQQPFSFNLFKDPTIANDPNSVVTVAYSPSTTATTFDDNLNGTDSRIHVGTASTYHQDAFGDFTNSLTCPTCNGSHGVPPPLLLKVTNLKGLTFAGTFPAGQDADQNNDGRLDTLGAGNRFKSNAGGWWFATDIYQTAPGCGNACTFVVAARDATTTIQNAVPEPASWALMILGFGGVGAVLRRRRTLTAVA